MSDHIPAEPPIDLSRRQREILERTFELVQEGGLANLTLKKVAERVGFTEAAIYRHFANKRDLIFGLIGQLEHRLLATVGRIGADLSLSPAARLEAMVRFHVGVIRGTQGLPLLLVSEGLATGDQELVTRLGNVMARYRAELAAMLRELDPAPSLPPEHHAMLFLALPAAVALQMRAHPEDQLNDDEVEAMVHFYVRALASPHSRPETLR